MQGFDRTIRDQPQPASSPTTTALSPRLTRSDMEDTRNGQSQDRIGYAACRSSTAVRPPRACIAPSDRTEPSSHGDLCAHEDHLRRRTETLMRWSLRSRDRRTARIPFSRRTFRRTTRSTSPSKSSPTIPGLPDGKGRWFYERARGSYGAAEAQGVVRAQARSGGFAQETPEGAQRFSKTDLAKYLNAWEEAGAPGELRQSEELSVLHAGAEGRAPGWVRAGCLRGSRRSLRRRSSSEPPYRSCGQRSSPPFRRTLSRTPSVAFPGRAADALIST